MAQEIRGARCGSHASAHPQLKSLFDFRLSSLSARATRIPRSLSRGTGSGPARRRCSFDLPLGALQYLRRRVRMF